MLFLEVFSNTFVAARREKKILSTMYKFFLVFLDRFREKCWGKRNQQQHHPHRTNEDEES